MSDSRCTFCDAYNPPGQRNCVSCGAELPGALELSPPSSEAGGLEDEVVRLANEQGIIPAIKHYREATGAGLAEAKAAVEGLIAGSLSTGTHGSAVSETELLAIVRDQGKIAAIKRHREATGSGLKEAKEAVEAMMARTGTAAGKSTAGCGTYVLLGLVAVIVVRRLSAGGF